MCNGELPKQSSSSRLRLPMRVRGLWVRHLRVAPLAEESALSPQEQVREELREALKRRQEENGYVKGWSKDKCMNPK